MYRMMVVLVFGWFLVGCQSLVEVGVDMEVGKGMRVVLLGTGTPNSEPDRWGSAAAIVVGGRSYLVDCGSGIVRRANAASEKYGIEALKLANLRRLFVTHLHSDHTVGFPDLILTPWIEGRDVPLEVYGPTGTARMAEHLLEAYDEDVQLRINGRQPSNPDGYKVNVHEIREGLIYEDELVKVKAMWVAHGMWEHAFCYRFETADRVVVVSGDRGPTPDIAEFAAGCDVLVHEVYSVKGFAGRVKVWQDYHSKAHTSSVELGELALKVQPEVVVLTHQLLWGATEEELMEEIRSVYDGRVEYGRDLDIY